MKRLAILFACLSLLAPMRADSGDDDRLPNDCAILATRAYARLHAAYWVKIFSFRLEIADPAGNGNKILLGHALVLWQAFPHSKIHAYDESGSVELSTRSHDVKDILAEFQKIMLVPIVDGHFWE
jgi:hypothetical protein